MMKDLIDFDKIVLIDLSQMMSRLNEDQKKVFDRVCQVLQNKNQIMWLYVSGDGDTGKSFLIETINTLDQNTLKKAIVLSHRYRGLTIYRMF